MCSRVACPLPALAGTHSAVEFALPRVYSVYGARAPDALRLPPRVDHASRHILYATQNGQHPVVTTVRHDDGRM